MPLIEIQVSQSDIDAAHRIASNIFPGDVIGVTHVRSTLASGLMLGMERMCVIWEDPVLHVVPRDYAIEDAK
jgi:hypothetical protein